VDCEHQVDGDRALGDRPAAGLPDLAAIRALEEVPQPRMTAKRTAGAPLAPDNLRWWSSGPPTQTSNMGDVQIHAQAVPGKESPANMQ